MVWSPIDIRKSVLLLLWKCPQASFLLFYWKICQKRNFFQNFGTSPYAQPLPPKSLMTQIIKTSLGRKIGWKEFQNNANYISHSIVIIISYLWKRVWNIKWCNLSDFNPICIFGLSLSSSFFSFLIFCGPGITNLTRISN